MPHACTENPLVEPSAIGLFAGLCLFEWLTDGCRKPIIYSMFLFELKTSR